MPNSNVTLVGNLTADPIIRTTNGGEVLANFSVAVSEGTKDNPSTGFYDVTAWRTLAEHVGESLHRGNRVIVEGVLKFSNFEDKEGNKRQKVQVTANSVGPDLRFNNVVVQSSERPSVPPAQQQYMSDEEWAAERARRGDQPAVSEAPF